MLGNLLFIIALYDFLHVKGDIDIASDNDSIAFCGVNRHISNTVISNSYVKRK